jgi:hypothetical protein
MFLSVAAWTEGGSVRPQVGVRKRANCPHGFVATSPFTTDSPLTLAGYSGEAAIPERPHQEGTIAPPRKPSRFVVDLWASLILACVRSGVGLSPVSVISHCEQATPPYTPWVRRK